MQAESQYAQNRLKLSLNIEGGKTFDLLLALHEAIKLIEEGYASGFNENDTGSYNFVIDTIN